MTRWTMLPPFPSRDDVAAGREQGDDDAHLERRLAAWRSAPPDARLLARLKAIPDGVPDARARTPAGRSFHGTPGAFGIGVLTRRWLLGEAALGLIALLAGLWLGMRTDVPETRLDVGIWLVAPAPDPLPTDWENAP